ncbi:molybdenum ABC transporter ATP-binding protein [Magnetofaba australis]|uniref:Putative molybdenum ABC transporter n=1 Tax=Magnetofaba australis IT-1 TaxID=1434232 RepID=A0A1Y2K2I1_9PROT|nr:molybdenum ABC transporter ATP-binding protein [Magnetofaba australis]OSM02240.1 putative molybdenum ABC transporter [Magnetofaba australis IT-1]
MSAIEAHFYGSQGEFSLDAAFSVPARGVTALFGPSGCGKTTVLRCVAGLNRRLEGKLSVRGQVWQDGKRFVPTHKRPIGYVFQEASLFPHLSVRENMLFGRKRAAPKGQTPRLDFDEVANLLGLTHLLERSPVRLSGGERQRVAIARALLTDPQILLMDEPMAALDRISKNEILPYLERLHETLDIPALYVSHDITEVERLADRMVLMKNGRVQAAGPLSTLLADPALPLAAMPEAATLLEGPVAAFDAHYGLAQVSVPGGTLLVPGDAALVGQRKRVRIAASDVAVARERAPTGSSILNALRAVIQHVEPYSFHQVNLFLSLEGSDDAEGAAGASLLARITRKSWDALDLNIGEEVHALIKAVALTRQSEGLIPGEEAEHG